MENFRTEYELSRLRGDMVFIGAAIIGALLLNAYVLIQIADDLHCLKEIEKEKMKTKIPLKNEEEITFASEKATEQPMASSEQKPGEEIKTENEKQ